MCMTATSISFCKCHALTRDLKLFQAHHMGEFAITNNVGQIDIKLANTNHVYTHEHVHTHTHVSKITSNFNTVNNLKQLPLYLRNSWLLKIFKPLWICMSPCVLATFVWFEPRSTSLSPTSSLPVQEFQNNTCFQVNSLNSSHNMHAQVHQNAWNVFEQITDTRKLYEFYVRITVKISVGFQ